MADTICALATAPGRAAVAVVRVSGPNTLRLLARLGVRRPTPRRASLRRLKTKQGATLDHALALWFPGPASYTGEDSAELHLHGAPVVVEAVLAALLEGGARLAQPGEFTRRAVENGRLDLVQAEGVADLIDAECQAQAGQAISQLEGALGRRYQAWRSKLKSVLSLLEASVDFPDEALPDNLMSRADATLSGLVAEMDEALRDGLRGRQVRDGYRVAIIGSPNAGKSSLLNALSGRDAAIVTPVAGATRDVIESHLVLEGYRIIVADMAGLRDTSEVVEAEGVRRALAWATAADRRVWVIDGAGESSDWLMAAECVRPGDLAVANKTDLPEGSGGRSAAEVARVRGLDVLAACLAAGDASQVRHWLARTVRDALGGGEFPATTRVRHVNRLRTSRECLVRARAALDEPELASEDVRLAVRELGQVTGAIGSEDVLDEVFSSFCIGK